MKYDGDPNSVGAGPVRCPGQSRPGRRERHRPASTTSVESSGLLANILPQFTAKTGITVNVVAQGTGKALDTARRGDADLLLVHDPEAERQFMDEGHGSTRRQIAWNDFVIVGPSADPAHIRGIRDSIAALKAIASAQA